MPTSGTGGAEHAAARLANRFCREHEVHFLAFEQQSTDAYPLEKGVTVTEGRALVKRGCKPLAVWYYLTGFAKQRRLLRDQIGRFDPDMVISFLPKADTLVYSLGKQFRFRWIASERNDPTARNRFERGFLTHIYKRAGALVCQTEKVSGYYRDRGVQKTCVIPNPLPQEHTEDAGSDEEGGYFIAAGRLDRQKNFAMLIRSFAAAVRGQGCTERLLILGEGPERKNLEQQAAASGMEGRISLPGNRRDIRACMRKAKALIISSDYEGLPNVMLEAMQEGVPVISTDYFSGAAGEYIGSESGILVPVGDEQALTDAIARLSQAGAEELRIMGRHGRETVRKLNEDRIAEEWYKLFERVLHDAG